MFLVFYILFALFGFKSSFAQNPHGFIEKKSESVRSEFDAKGPENSAIYDLIRKNGGKLPNTLTELRHFLDNSYRVYGEIRTSTIPFSDAPGYTDLEEARNIYISPLNDLYIGAIPRNDGSVDLEFISRNDSTNKFEFGVIKNFGKSNAEISIVDKSKCTVCHKAGGPIFPVFDWKNTINDGGRLVGSNLGSFRLVYRAFLKKLAEKDSNFLELHQTTEHVVEDVISKPIPFGRNPPQYLNEQVTEKTAPLVKMWHGALVAPIPAVVVENLVRDGNQVLVLRDWLERGATPSIRNNAIRYFLGEVFGENLGSSYKHADYIEDFLKFSGNIPVIVNQHSLNHIVKGPVETVDDVIKISDTKRQKMLKNTSPEESPLNPESFVKESRPLLGAGTGIMENETMMMAYSNSLGILRRGELISENGKYRSIIHRYVPGLLSEEEFSRFSKSDIFMSFVSKQHLPNRSEFNAAVLAWKNKGEYTINNPTRPVMPLVPRKKACIECHFGPEAVLPIPFDPGSVETWEQMFSSKDPKLIASAKRWLEPVLNHLKNSTMPPKPFENHLGKNELAALIRYLSNMKDK